MSEIFTSVRRQHAIGQGFFHSAYLSADDYHQLRTVGPKIPPGALTYVYDCGAVAKYTADRDREIRRLQADLGTAALDFLFISHLHDDHVNGIPSLLASTNVDTIVMPLMSVVERLIVLAASLANGAAPEAFYAGLALDPVSALEPYSPRQIIFVRRAGGDGVQIDDEAPPRDVDPVGDAHRDFELGWKLVGRGMAAEGHPEDESLRERLVHSTRVLTTDDVNAFAIRSQSRRWLLSPYVHQGSADEAKFAKGLAKELRKRPQSVRESLLDPAFRTLLVTKHLPQLRVAFHTLESDLNFTSLCLYSGPVPIEKLIDLQCPGYYLAKTNRWYARMERSRSAWLATGDANLKSKRRLWPFLHHYRRLVDQVGTLTVPHHGSAESSDGELYDHIEPNLCVAAADMFNNWRHPAASVSQAISSSGALLALVSSHDMTTLTEYAHLPH